MNIPEIFFGNKKEVRSKLNIIANKTLKLGLSDQFNKINCIDTNMLNDFTINYNVQYDFMTFKNCFYISELTKLLFFSEKYSTEEYLEIKNENIEFLSKSTWGNLILNNPTNYFLVKDYKYNYDEFIGEEHINRERCSIILKGIIENFHEYEMNKNNIYDPLCKFPDINMLYKYVVCNCSIEKYEDNFEINNNTLFNVCNELYKKINDNNYWNKLIEKIRETEIINKNNSKQENKKRLKEEIEWYKNEMKNKKM